MMISKEHSEGLGVAMLTCDYLPRIGGIEGHLQGLTGSLARLGCRVAVLHTVYEEPAPGLPAGHDPAVQYVPVLISQPRIRPRRILATYPLAARLNSFLSQNHFDIVHAHTLMPEAPALKLLRRGPRRVFTNHTAEFLEVCRKVWGRALMRFLIRDLDGLIACSPERVERSRVLGLPESRMRYIPNGADLDRYSPGDMREARARLGLDQAAKIILCPSRMAQEKGERYLAQALPLIAGALGDIKIIFCGDEVDGELERCRKIVAENGQEGRAVFVGSVSNRLMPDYYLAADAVVLPSLVEATSLSGLEALACARPVVASRVDGLSVIIEDRVSGVLVPPAQARSLAEAVISVLRDQDLARALGRAGRERVIKNFSWDAAAAATLEFYRELLVMRSGAEK